MTTSAPPGASTPDPTRLSTIANDALEAMLDRSPVGATYLGDHRRDALLDDPSADAAAGRAAQLRTQLATLDSVETTTTDEAVDAAVLRTALAAELFGLTDIAEGDWNPIEHNPGGGLHALLSRDFAPLAERIPPLVARLAAVPDYLDAARRRLGVMSAVHLETALLQLDGAVDLIDNEVSAAADQVPGSRSTVAPAAAHARAALVEYREWLAQQVDTAVRDPRIGEQLFRAKLALTLDTAFDPVTLLARAEADLSRIAEQIIEHAGRLAGVGQPDSDTVRQVLADLAEHAPTDATILGLCGDALASSTTFVREHDLVTVYDDRVNIVEMPEIDRGVAVAYCRENGPLEQATLPTEIAVSPTPKGWTREQIDSFYREYNVHMLHDLIVHEAMPGHALQLMHSNRHRADTRVRAVWGSGSFIEGWAVYAEELMADRGYLADVSAAGAAAVRMQQLKMQLRTTINAILDIRFHCGDLDENAAVALMTERGFQEQGEAIGKWRRVQLSSTQLCTYYVGYTEVRAVAADLAAAHPDWPERNVHDAMLAHGSPPARHLRTLLGLTGG